MTNLKRIRMDCEFSQSQQATQSGLNVRMIQYYEQQTKDINKAEAATVYRLACALGCKMEKLLDL